MMKIVETMRPLESERLSQGAPDQNSRLIYILQRNVELGIWTVLPNSDTIKITGIDSLVWWNTGFEIDELRYADIH